METPAIQFSTSSDGTRIAFMASGQGTPLLILLSWATNMEWDWRDAECRIWLERLSSGRRVVYCGRRGVAPSQREVSDFSLDAQVQDLEAVVARLGIDRFDVLASYEAASLVATYTASHPERIKRIVLWSPIVRGSDVNSPERATSLAELMRVNWSFARRAWAELCFPSDPGGRGRWFSDLLKNSVSSDVASGYMEFTRDLDARDALARLSSPVLLLSRSENLFVPTSVVSATATLIENVRMVTVEGDIGHPPLGDISYIETITDFLDEERRPREDTLVTGSGMAVILFTDIVSSTELTEQLGDGRFREMSRALDAGLRAAIRDAGGVAVEGKLLGDGVLATFGSAAQAIDGARRCLALSAASQLGLHIGLHAGDVIREDGNVFGGAVNIAARICGLSAPGEILVSDVVRGMARSSAGVTFEDRGEQEMKGVGEPVRVYAVRELQT